MAISRKRSWKDLHCFSQSRLSTCHWKCDILKSFIGQNGLHTRSKNRHPRMWFFYFYFLFFYQMTPRWCFSPVISWSFQRLCTPFVRVGHIFIWLLNLLLALLNLQLVLAGTSADQMASAEVCLDWALLHRTLFNQTRLTLIQRSVLDCISAWTIALPGVHAPRAIVCGCMCTWLCVCDFNLNHVWIFLDTMYYKCDQF